MLSYFKNHNVMMPDHIMMPVDLGDKPYLIKKPSPKDIDKTDTSAASSWDWNKLFVPIQVNHPVDAETFKSTSPAIDAPYTKKPATYASPFTSPFAKKPNATIPDSTPTLKTDDNEHFKYASPFASKTAITNKSPLALNPNAPSFNATLNINAPSFHMDGTQPQTVPNLTVNPFSKPKPMSKPKPEIISDETILAMHGFKKIRKMENSLQGAIYYGETIRGHDITKQLGIPKNKKRRVVIKKTLKALHNKRITLEDNGMNICVDENVVKEAILLHHLTVDNNPAGSAICKLISFFESTNAYFIVMEYGGSMTLKKFVDKAHMYIRKGKLKVSHWKKICKYVMWQIAATLYWMHTDMHCVHLDLTLENIVVHNGKFNINEKDGSVTIDRSLSCKIVDFGLSEMFKADEGKPKRYFEYDCDDRKLGLFHVNSKYAIANGGNVCPQMFNEQVYDGRKADIWSLGNILFYMSFGIYPFEKQMSADSGYWSIKHKKLDLFLDMQHLSHLYNRKLMDIIEGCLCIDEKERYNIGKVITNCWFKTYFKRYADKMQQQSQSQLAKNKKDQRKMNQNIPFYKASTPTYQ